MRIFNNYQFIYVKSPEVIALFLLSTVLCASTVCALFFFFLDCVHFIFSQNFVISFVRNLVYLNVLSNYTFIILQYRATFTNLLNI